MLLVRLQVCRVKTETRLLHPHYRSWGWEGVYVTTESRKPRDVRGHVLPLRFKVIDNRPPVAGAAAAQAAAEVAAGKKASKVRLSVQLGRVAVVGGWASG